MLFYWDPHFPALFFLHSVFHQRWFISGASFVKMFLILYSKMSDVGLCESRESIKALLYLSVKKGSLVISFSIRPAQVRLLIRRSHGAEEKIQCGRSRSMMVEEFEATHNLVIKVRQHTQNCQRRTEWVATKRSAVDIRKGLASNSTHTEQISKWFLSSSS